MQAWIWISPLARRTGVAIGLKSIAAHILLKWSMAGNLGDKCYRFKEKRPIGRQTTILLPLLPSGESDCLVCQAFCHGRPSLM
ncbi:hypothetical protein ACC680_33840, partial [Rhizobium ruizarguesonis]